MPSRLVHVVLALSLSVLGSTVLIEPASAASARSLSLKISASTAATGSQVTLSGKLTKSPKGSALEIQRKAGSKWTRITSLKTDKKGQFTYRLRAGSAGTTVLRAVAKKTKKLKAATSPTRTLRVTPTPAPTPAPAPAPAPSPTPSPTAEPTGEPPTSPTSLTLDVSPATAQLGETVTFSGTVAPYRTGTPIALQRDAGGTWVNASVGTVSAGGTFSFEVTPALGTSTYRVSKPRDEGYLAAVSPTRTVSVTTGTDQQFSTAPLPTISGEAKVGKTLTAQTGTWSPTPDAFTYQWLQNGSAVPGATGSTFVPSQSGATFSVQVTGSRAGYSTVTRTSATTSASTKGDLQAPVPVISGTGQVGQTVTATTGTWEPAPVALTYRWLRGSSAIQGATADTYIITTADKGAQLTVEVSGTRSEYSTSKKTSSPLAVAADTATHVSGTISTDTVWADGGDTSYVLDSTITVAKGATLTIRPGTIVKAKPGYGMTVSGVLRSEGTASSPVIFTSVRDDSVGGDTNNDGGTTAPQPGGWGGISVAERGSFTADHTQVTYSTGINSSGADTFVLRHGSISTSSGPGVNAYVDRSGANAGTAVVEISDTTVSDVTDAGIRVSATGQPVGAGTQIPVPVVRNNTVTKAGAAAIRVHGDALDGATLRDNTGTGSRPNQIQLSGNVTTDINVPLGGLPLGFNSTGSLHVAPDATMTIAAGTTIKGASYGLVVSGVLTSQGTAGSPVIFTSVRDDTVGGDTNNDSDATSPVAGGWGGINIAEDGSFTADHTQVNYSTGIYSSGADTFVLRHGSITKSSGPGVNAFVDRSGANAGTAVVEISDTTVTDVADTGIRVTATGQPLGAGTQIPVPVVERNTVTRAAGAAIRVQGDALDGAALRDNTGTGSRPNQIQLSGNVTTDINLPLGGLPLGFNSSGSLHVAPDATMTIAAGTTVKGASSGLIVSGVLRSEGTAGSPVIFTSVRDDTVGGDTNNDSDATSPQAGSWGGITVAEDGSFTADHTHVNYGTGIYSSGAGRFVLRHGSISNSIGPGVNAFVDRSGANAGTAVVEISDTTVTDVTDTGIRVSATGQPIGAGTQVPVPVVRNNTVTRAAGAAIRVQGDALDGATLRDNTGTGSHPNQIQLSGTLTTDINVPLGGLPLGFSSSNYLHVAAGSTMTIAAGTTIKAASAGLIVSGVLKSEGTAGSPVVFTSVRDDSVGGDTGNDSDATSPQPGGWSGITVNEHGSFTADHTQVNYSTGIYSNGADRFVLRHGTVTKASSTGVTAFVDRSGANTGTAVVEISDTTVTDAGELGIRVSATGQPIGSGTQIPVPVVRNNTVTRAAGAAIRVNGDALNAATLRDNTGTGSHPNQIQLSGSVTTDIAVPLGGLPLGFNSTGNLDIAADATMTVAAGTVIKGRTTGLVVYGKLKASGTSAAPVVFTSVRDDTIGGDTGNDSDATSPAAGDWSGVIVSGSGEADLESTTIRYASTALWVESDANATWRGKVQNSSQGLQANGYVDATGVDWGSASGPHPYGTGAPVRGGGANVMPWVGYTPPPRPARAAAQPAPPDATCTDVVMFGLRGSGEAPQGPNETTLPSFGTGGFGTDTLLIAARAEERIKELKPNATVKRVPIQYLALATPITKSSVSWDEFFDSVFQGIDKLDQAMTAEHARCPNSQLVIIGYSQGALAAHYQLQSTYDSSVRAKIAAAALLADPARVANGEETLWQSDFTPAQDGVKNIPGPLQLKILDAGVFDPIPSELAVRTISMCHQGDIVCAPRLGASIDRHTDYTMDELDSMGLWVGTRVAARL